MNSPEPQFHEVPAHEIRRDPVPPVQSVAPKYFGPLVYGGLPLLLAMCILPGFVQMFIRFVFGWAFFLREQLPEILPSRMDIVFGLIAIVLLAGGLHAVVRTRYRPQEPWRAQWTCELLVMAALLFAIGTAVGGFGRQLEALFRLPQWVYDTGRAGARRSQSKNNLKQIGLALLNYHDAQNSLPAGGTFDDVGQPLHGWITPLLPYIDQAPLYQQIRHDLPWTAPENQAAFKTQFYVVKIPFPYEVPAFTPEGYAVADYAANVHVLGPDHALAFRQMTDGMSNTIAAGEVVANPRAWGDPRNWRDPGLGINASPDGFGSPWRGRCNMLFADGSVKFLSEKIDPAVLRKLATPSGGEKIDGAVDGL
jgi:prepilin-type processing-associated H-X9-DG protein